MKEVENSRTRYIRVHAAEGKKKTKGSTVLVKNAGFCYHASMLLGLLLTLMNKQDSSTINIQCTT